ncbi:MAG: iron uptake transporter deferrochelatase/peroxidase subunit [Actinomycetota bacterium]
MDPEPEGERTGNNGGVSRRQALAWLGAAGIGAAAGAGGVRFADRTRGSSTATEDRRAEVVPFHGPHQSGIVTPQQRHIVFASLDLADRSRGDLRALFRYWTTAAARLTLGRAPAGGPGKSSEVPWDTGEAVGLGPSSLTVTFGVGPALFTADGRDVLGLAARRPDALVDLPVFPTDDLDPARTGGALCIQACADDVQVAFHAVRELVRLGHGLVSVRWSQAGFLPEVGAGVTPRNLLGFKDGTNNVRDVSDAARFVWVGAEGPAWMRDGTYLVARRIDVRIDRWDGSSLGEQERVIGRRKGSGAPLTGRAEHDRIDFHALGGGGLPVIPTNAHVRLAGPDSNAGQRILRRPYSFVDGGGGEGNLEGGLFFLAFQRDPRRQFIPIQRRLARSDALNEYLRHTGSAVFAILPGVRPGSFLGQELL